ncbi:MAG TPA: sigma-70 family RNA polymerase sigma factor, partial [Tepidisphaeraceae bacterium]|nr:sigma-70 family RNA polymerase sigma factor [Tepidisphaeraceae bacterium]
IDALRRRKTTEPLSAVSEAADAMRWTADPVTEAGRREEQKRIASAIASLDELSRLVVVMRYYENASSKEIAEALDLTPASVDMRLSRARRQLKALLEESPEPASAG